MNLSLLKLKLLSHSRQEIVDLWFLYFGLIDLLPRNVRKSSNYDNKYEEPCSEGFS